MTSTVSDSAGALASGEPSGTASPDERRPVLRVVRGDATAEEIAAVVAVVSALGSPAPEAAPTRSRWAMPAVRTPLAPGRGAWRASALPR